MLKNIIYVGIGSLVGGIFRYLSQFFFLRHFNTSLPLGTLFVNILGSFIIGLIFGISQKTTYFSNDIKLFLATGFCGGFTTFSSFSIENINLLRDGQYFYVGFYTTLSVLFGFTAAFLGYKLVKII